VLGAPLPSLRGVPGTIARQNATRNPKRTAAAASALMLCVGLVSFITIFASSATAAVNTIYNRAFTGDFIINSGAGETGGVHPALAQRVSQLPPVALASGLRAGMAKIEGGVQEVFAVDTRTAFGILDIQPLQGNQNDLGRDACPPPRPRPGARAATPSPGRATPAAPPGASPPTRKRCVYVRVTVARCPGYVGTPKSTGEFSSLNFTTTGAAGAVRRAPASRSRRLRPLAAMTARIRRSRDRGMRSPSL
jgi:hypothetical protein